MASSAALELIIGVQDKASKPIKAITGGLASLGKAAGGLALGGLAVATVGVGALGAALAGGIADARDAARVMAQTESVIKSTGGAAGLTAEQIAEMAGALSAAEGKSLFGDSDIQNAQNMLLTFTKIGSDTFPRATAAMVDMATAMGTDVNAGAIQMGKALNDPIAGVGALSKVGVQFTDEQKNMIKTMVETGNIAGAQAVILGELETQFGGSAAAAAAADGGWAQFNDRMGELAESVGARVLPVLNQLMGWLNSPEVQAGITAVVDGLSNGVVRIGEVIASVTAAFQNGGLAGVFDLILPKLQEFGASVLTWITEQAPIWGAQLWAWGEALVGWLSPYIPVLLERLGAFAGAAFAWIGEQAPVFLERLGAWGIEFTTWILPKIPDMLVNLGTLASNVIAWIAEQIPTIKSAVTTWGNALYEWVQETAIPGLGPALSTFDAEMGRLLQVALDNATDASLKGGGQIITSLAQGFTDQMGTWRLSLDDWAGTLFAWLDEMAPQVYPKAVAIATAIIDAMNAEVVGLGPALDRWAAAIMAWADQTAASVIGWVKQVGANMITGMIAGVTEQASRLAAAAAKVVLDAIQAAKNAILSRSPSQKTRDEIGIPIVQGVIVGIEKEAPNLRTAASNLGTKVPEWMDEGLRLSEPVFIQKLGTLGKKVPDWIAAGVDEKKMLPVKQAIIQNLGDPKFMDDTKKVAGKLGKAVDQGMADEIKKQPTAVKQAIIQNLGDPKFLAETGEKARRLGVATKQGIIRGLVEQSEEFLRNVVNLGDPGLMDAAAEKGKAVGKAYVQGMAAGARSASNDFISAISGITGGKPFGQGDPSPGGQVVQPTPGNDLGASTVGNSTYINVDARGSSDPRAVERAVERALQKAGHRADTRMRTA